MGAPSIKDLQDQGRTVMLVRRGDLDGDEGDVSMMMRDVGVAMADVNLGNHASETASTYLDGARDEKLTELADDHFSTVREEAVASIGQVTFTRVGGSGPAYTIPADTRLATQSATDGSFQEFTTDIDLVFGSSDTVLSVAATATVPGTEGNVIATKVVRILDTLTYDFTITNAEPFVGGAPEQDDDSLVEEVREREATLRRGTKAAVEFGAKTVPSVKVATAIMGGSTPTVYVSDADGNSNSQMVSDVQAVMPDWQAFGNAVTVVGASLSTQTIDISFTVRTGVDSNSLADRIRNSIVNSVNRLKVSDTLFRGLIETAARNVDRDNIVSVTVNTPAANVVPAANELIRTGLANVSIT